MEADLAAAPSIEVWGTGKPIREFIYVEDCADAIVLAAEKYNDVNLPLNVGTGIGTSIKELVETINEVTGFKGKIVWNTDKPDGAVKKVLDVTRMKRELDGWAPPTSLRARAGQDDLMVPGQQGSGGREMVSPSVLVSRRPETDSTHVRSLGALRRREAAPLGLDDDVDPRSHDDERERTGETSHRPGESSSSTSITGPITPRPPST